MPGNQKKIGTWRRIRNIGEMALKKKNGEFKFPIILPIVLYHGAESWDMGTTLHNLVAYPARFTPFLPDFEFVLWDASRYPDETIKEPSSYR